jgi:hypothetical protein
MNTKVRIGDTFQQGTAHFLGGCVAHRMCR